MGREENIEVFNDTEKLCKSNPRLLASVKKATSGQKLFLEGTPIPARNRAVAEMAIYADPANVVVSSKRTYEAAAAYKGQRVAVLNFASASNPGGGVVTGAGAQEECLCRCSGLYFSLNTPDMWAGFYEPHRRAHDPIHNDDIIFTPQVTVFKTDTATPRLMPEAEWYDVDVITCAAPNLRERPTNRYNTGVGDRQALLTDKELLALHEKRLRRILDVAVSEGCETIILGAFGCGAFQNNPEVVALANRNVIGDYLRGFRTIEYAVYCSPHDDRNFKIFKRVLGRY